MVSVIELRNKLNKKVYSVQRKFLFSKDPEIVHERMTRFGKFLGSNVFSRKIVSGMFNYQSPMLEQTICGIRFRNPIGLSGGFDKNAEMVSIMGSVGFGFVEIGSVTAKPCAGNKGKRLKRLVDDKALWVNYGLNNHGARVIRDKLRGKKFNIPLGVNIAKTNCKETANLKVGREDYLEGLKIMKSIGDYFVLNISCPNAFGGRPFSEPRPYKELLNDVEKLKIKKPIFVKLSPDLKKKEVDKIINISDRYSVSGFICTNLTKRGLKESGGYSGKLVEKKANEMLSYVYKKIRKKKKYVLIGSGGIFSAQDAYRKIKLGANLVQLITGMVYQGPGLIGEINYELVKLLKKDNYKNISEAVGKAHR